MSAGRAFGAGVLWATAIAVVAYFFGLYALAADVQGAWVVVLPFASVGLAVLFLGHSKLIAIINFEACLLALWYGHLSGSLAGSGFCDIAWFCVVFLWPWAFFAIVGGIVVALSSRRTESVECSARRIGVAVLAVAAVALAGGFAKISWSEELPVATFRAQRFFLKAMAISPDGRTLATAAPVNGSRNVRLSDVATGRTVGACRKQATDDGMLNPVLGCFGTPPVVAAAESFWSGRATAKNVLAIQTWDLATQEPARRWEWDDGIAIRNPVFSRDGRWLVYASGGGALRAFDLQQERITVDLKRVDQSVIDCVAVSVARDRIACGTDKSQVEIWDATGARVIQQTEAAGRVNCMEFSPDGRLPACGERSGKVELLEIGTENVVHELSCCEHGGVNAVAFSPDSKLLACCGETGAQVVDVQRWKVVAEPRLWGGWGIACLTFSPDGNRLVAGDASGRVGVWDARRWPRKPE